MKLIGYQLAEKIHEGETSIIHRGVRESDNLSVIVKTLKDESLTDKKLDPLKYEYEIAKDLDLPGIIKMHSIEQSDYDKAIVMEDFGATSLDKYLAQKPIDLKLFLQIAINLSDILGAIHRRSIIHKAINPQNILINPGTKEIKIADFAMASRIQRELQPEVEQQMSASSLSYISPEQTGRMNRSIDYRTDFYSLGVTFYEMLTGSPPFVSDDPLELVHAHIARIPLPPNEANKDVPEVVSNIVMKLVAKTAEERYQSSAGLKADLEKCQQQLQRKGIVEKYDIGITDVLEKFEIPEKLYGREKECEVLFDEFARVSAGESRMVIFSGPPGIGKSFLIHEIHKPLVEYKGYFITGKFDQYKRDIPYSAIIQAFKGLMKQILAEPQDKLAEWKSRILKAIGPNCRVLTDVIPELELIIGQQPAVQSLGPIEARNRFNLAFQSFVRIFSRAEHPLVIFIDDWQWADFGSLVLLKVLMTDAELKYLLLIGAYRDNEVDASHPFIKTLSEIESGLQTGIRQLTLKPLLLTHLNQLLMDTLHCTTNKAKPLSRLIEQKTQGNPFFVKQFLQALYLDNLLLFDLNSLSWKWNIATIMQKEVTDNVVDLMVARLRGLPQKTQEVLKPASCIGDKFNLNILAMVYGRSVSDTINDLWEAINEGFILPQDEKYKILLETGESELDIDSSFKFLHDRVKQAAYALFTKKDREKTHLKIGKILLEQTKEESIEDEIFHIVNQMNQSIGLIKDDSEKRQLAELNLVAGKRAKASAAYQSALSYYTVGTDLLKKSDWRTNYDLTFDLFKERAEAEYLNGHIEKSEKLINVLLEKARSELEKVYIHNIQIVQHTTVAKYKEALQVARKALSLLGVNLPMKPSKLRIMIEMLKIKYSLRKRRLEDLIHLPEMVDPEKKAMIRILGTMTPLAYFIQPKLLSLISPKMISISLKHGLSADAATGYACYGLVLSARLRDYKAAYEFELLAIKISEKYNNQYQKCIASFLLGSFVSAWVKPIQHSITTLSDAYQAGLESGALQWAAYALIYKIRNMFFQGNTLTQIQKETAAALIFSQKNENQMAFDANMTFHLLMSNLQGKTSDEFSLSTDDINESSFLKSMHDHNSLIAIYQYHVAKLQILYMYGQCKKALECTLEANKLLEHAMGNIRVVEHNFYHSLILSALYTSASGEEREQYMGQLKVNQRQMKEWADNCHENFLHKYLLVGAEIARVSGNVHRATDLYDQSIESARDNEFIQNEALACELTARFWLERGKEEIARSYMKKAYDGYQAWGAIRKAKDLETKYPQLLEIFEKYKESHPLDIETVMKTSQTISSEIMLDKLLSKLMRIIIENAGAEMGSLILESDGRLLVETVSSVDQEDVLVRLSIPIEHYESCSPAIVNYVSRTQESIVEGNAAQSGIFANDPYIKERGIKSVLCTPIIYTSRLIGIIYLENNLVTDAFTPQRQEIIRLLAGQAAISLENAKLYSSLVQEVADRVRAEEDLLKEKTFSDTSINTVPGIYYVFDDKGKFLSWNRWAEEVLEYSPEEISRMHPLDMIPDEDKERVAEAINRVFTAGEAVVEASFLTKSGNKIPHRMTGRRMMLNNKAYLAGVALDMTERIKMEEALRESEEIYRSVVDLGAEVGEAVIMLEDIDQKAGMHVFISKEWSRITGYSEQELLNMSFFDLVHPKDRKASLERHKRRMSGETIPELFEIQIIRKDGNEVPIELTSAYTTYRGRHANVAYIREITERKKMQEQLMVTNRLASIGEMASGTAHELNNPLNSIVGLSELLMEREVPVDMKDEINFIHKEAQRTAQIIQNLLTFARKHKREKEPISINDVILIVLELRAYELRASRIEVNTQFAINLPNVMANTSQLQQVFINLIINAEYFMKKEHNRGMLTITTERADDMVRTSVTDDGPGIAKEDMEHVFDPFFTTKEAGKGTGLGLSICHGIINEHGGSIHVESKLGKGATFIVELPIFKKRQR